jgi:arylsulfatase A
MFRALLNLTLFCLVFCSRAVAAEKPNFIVVLIDDMGVTDLSCQGSKFYQTPHIDRLAKEGFRATNAYSACTVCSPTRAAMMTGKYPARLHITDWIAGHQRLKAKLQIPDWQKSLPLEEVTIAELLNPLGYRCASFGKWHLGNEGQLPTDQGFAKHIGGYMHGQPPSYFAPYKMPGVPDGPNGEYITDRLTDEVIKFIDESAKQPFLVYLPHFTVHTPIQAKTEITDKYRKLVDPNNAQKNPAYAAMIESLDLGIGRIREKLEALKLDKNTIIIFTSDNGGLMNITANPPYRVGKGSAYEGGVRVPFIAWGPGRIPAGKTNDTPLMTIDILPTVAELSGVKELPKHVDGVSLLPILTGTGKLTDRPLYWHYPHYHPGGATPYSAIRLGDYRLIEFFEDGHLELYNLANDVGEQENLVQKEPAIAKQLHDQLLKWRQSVVAQLPTPNPNYDPKDTGKKK